MGRIFYLRRGGFFDNLMRMRTLIKDIILKEGEDVVLSGYVAARRDHGKIIFIDLRDRSGECQLVFVGKELYAQADLLRSEWVVSIKGKVNKRPPAMVNKNILTGEYEILVESFEVLNEAKTPPFEVASSGYDIGEDVRMKYRYIDLRRSRLAHNMTMRHKTQLFIRNWLSENKFIEVETPILTKSTPEGARDYVVPSRLYSGKFYALPQSPRQYKQLLMSAGIERYFQFAR